MARLNFCSNGVPLTTQVTKFKFSQKDEDYQPIQEYYEDFMDVWFAKVERFIDRQSFESGFNAKTLQAVESFDVDLALAMAKERGWSLDGMFNRFWFRIIANWCSNIKNSSFRPKSRPSICCPVCHRDVTRIDAEHLKHLRTVRDLPQFLVWEDKIYETATKPRNYAVCWGEFEQEKFTALEQGRADCKTTWEKERVSWPWHENDEPMVACPFTGRLIPKIDTEYFEGLPEEFQTYAESITWETFIEHFPSALIQAETYELCYADYGGDEDEDDALKDRIVRDERLAESVAPMTSEEILSGTIDPAYEELFSTIEKLGVDNVSQMTLKLLANDFTVSDIAEILSKKRSDIQNCIKGIAEAIPNLGELLGVSRPGSFVG